MGSFLDTLDSADDVPTKDVVVPEWKGVTIHLRALDCDGSVAVEAALDEYRQATGATKVPSMRVAATALCYMIRNDDGTALGIGALDRLLRRSPAVISRLFSMASGLLPTVETLAGESGAVPSGASSSS